MENKLLKKNIYNKTIENLKKKKLTSLELECLIDKLYIKLNNLSDMELLELDTLNFIVTLENNDINLNIVNKQDKESIDKQETKDKQETINEQETITKQETITEQEMIDLLNYRTTLLQDLEESISDLDNFNTVKKLVLQTPLHKIKDINFNFNNITINKTELHNFSTKVKCDIINDTKFNYNKFKDKVFNDINNIPYNVIKDVNKDPILYNNLLNNIKLKYLLLQFINELISNKEGYIDNIDVYNNHYKNIEERIDTLSIDKIYIIKKNLNYIPKSVSLDNFIVDFNDFINNLLVENDIDKLHKLILYEKPKSQLNYSDPIDRLLSKGDLPLKKKCILAAAKFQQQVNTKKIKEAKEIEMKEQPNIVYTPVKKVAIQTVQHYFPSLINIQYKDDLNKNIFYGTLTGEDKKDNVKKWKNF
jgi:hypothetical protein